MCRETYRCNYYIYIYIYTYVHIERWQVLDRRGAAGALRLQRRGGLFQGLARGHDVISCVTYYYDYITSIIAMTFVITINIITIATTISIITITGSAWWSIPRTRARTRHHRINGSYNMCR